MKRGAGKRKWFFEWELKRKNCILLLSIVGWLSVQWLTHALHNYMYWPYDEIKCLLAPLFYMRDAVDPIIIIIHILNDKYKCMRSVVVLEVLITTRRPCMHTKCIRSEMTLYNYTSTLLFSFIHIHLSFRAVLSSSAYD